MRTSFTVNDMTIHRIVEQEAGFTPILDFLPSLTQGTLGREPRRGWSRRARPRAGNGVLCFQSYVVKTPHHNILVDACIGNDKIFPAAPDLAQQERRQLDAGAEGGRPRGRRHRLRHVHASARRPCRLEHAAGERPLGPDLSQGALPVLEKRIRTIGARSIAKTPLDQMHGQRAADHRGQQGRAGHQRPCAQRPYPADPDPRPHARPFRGLRRARRRPGGVHRRSDPFADPGALSRIWSCGSTTTGRRPSGHPPAFLRALLRHRHACAARCTSRRPRSATSSAGATASAWNTQKPEDTERS